MKKLILSLAALLAMPAFGITATPSGYTIVSGSALVDASGNPLASGVITFQVVDASGRPLSVKIGTGGQVVTTPATATVTNGAFFAQVVDVSQTAPSFPCVEAIVTDNSTGNVVWQDNCLQPIGPYFSLDFYSTNSTPVQPQAGSTVQGNLTVNGSFSTTGAFSPGAVYSSLLDANTIQGSVNGVLNAARYPGSDIGAKVNAAYAGCPQLACAVMIPPGNYTYSTDIIMPNTAMTTLEISPGATLNYTGSGFAVRTSIGPGDGNPYEGNYFIKGGHIIGTSSAAGAILLAPAVNDTEVDGVEIHAFPNGDGILDVGTNAATIQNSKIAGCLVGLHLMASPGYASNNVLALRNVIASNGWGVINGDVSIWQSAWKFSAAPIPTTGVASPNYGNMFLSNDLEANSKGAAIEGLTVGSIYENNYIESNPRGIVLGMTELPMTAAQYQSLYGISGSNGGTARGSGVINNYWTVGGIHSLIEIRAAGYSNIEGNSTDGPSGTVCMVDAYIGGPVNLGTNEADKVSSLTCQGGNPAAWPFINTVNAPLAVTGAISAGGAISSTGAFTLNSTASPGSGGFGPVVGTMGEISIYQTPTAPSGTCSGANIDIGPFGMAVCQGGTWTVK